jgi:hypothetical protein
MLHYQWLELLSAQYSNDRNICLDADYGEKRNRGLPYTVGKFGRWDKYGESKGLTEYSQGYQHT